MYYQLFRRSMPLLAYVGIFVLLTAHPALASTASGSGGVFAGIVKLMTDFKTAVVLTLGPLCFVLWVASAGAIVSNGGHMNGLAWTALGSAFGVTLLLFADVVISSLGSGALV